MVKPRLRHKAAPNTSLQPTRFGPLARATKRRAELSVCHIESPGAARRPTLVQVGTAGAEPRSAPHSSGAPGRKRPVTLRSGVPLNSALR